MNSHRVLDAFRGRLLRLPVGRHPALYFDPWLEGYRDYAFGGRAGPSVKISSVFHELGHASQFGPDMFRTRASDAGFHFKVHHVTVLGERYAEPRTSQCTDRELDAFAYQLHLMRIAGFKVSDRQFASHCGELMKWMPDWYHVPGEDEESRAAYCGDLVMQRYAALTPAIAIDRLEAWLDLTHRRLKRLKQRFPQPWTASLKARRYRTDGSVWLSR